MKPIKQTVYLPVKVEDELPDKNYSDELHSDCGLVGFENGVFGKWDNNKGIWNYPIKVRTWLKPQEAFVFTPEQLNEYTANVIQQALKAAAEKTEVVNKAKFKGDCNPAVDEESIINIYEEVYKKLKV